MQKLTKTFKYGDHDVTLETGQIARQAGGSVMVSMGDTRVIGDRCWPQRGRSRPSLLPADG